MAEFELVDLIRARVAAREGVVLGIGDDAALLRVPEGHELVVTADTLNAGVHFPAGTAPADIGWKALAVNLSDLASMGARPAWCTLSLSLSLPAEDRAWLEGFLDGFLGLAALHGIALVGGDTTRGPLSIAVTAMGLVETGAALRRDRARVGDDVWVTGTLGDATAALVLGGHVPPPPGLAPRYADAPYPSFLALRLNRPTPRIEAGRALLGLARACVDVSDGLLADLGHVCERSGVGAEVAVGALPASAALRSAFGAQCHLLQVGGDDYELCFTAPPSLRDDVAAALEQVGVDGTRIGRIVAGAGVRALAADGSDWHPPRAGYVHFG